MHQPIHELTDAFRRGDLTPTAVAEDYLFRIGALDGKVGAYLTVVREQALAAARESELRWRAGAPRGPLDGAPVALKDVLCTAGVRTTCGSKMLERFVPPYDATTVERLRAAIEVLKAKKQEISVQTIFDECGLRYAAIHRNPEALALFRANSTSLAARKKRSRNKNTRSDEETISSRDPLLAYKKPHLVERVRTAEQRLLDVQQQLAVQIDANMQREARIAALEARLVELEPYRTFVEQMRAQMQREEQGRFGDLP